MPCSPSLPSLQAGDCCWPTPSAIVGGSRRRELPCCLSGWVDSDLMTHSAHAEPSEPAPVHRTHPVNAAMMAKRASSLQLKIADQITAFAGSMNFVYIHALVFAVWMTVFEASPWPTLTLIVSLEAIFLSTFVMIG